MKRMLINRFRGATVSIQEIEDYILAETPFRKTGYKGEVLKPMEKAKPPQIRVLGSKVGRKVGQYPDSSLRIQFL